MSDLLSLGLFCGSFGLVVVVWFVFWEALWLGVMVLFFGLSFGG